MKRIPLLLATLALFGNLPIAPAEETAADLATQRDLGDNPTTVESASALAAQRGEAIDPRDTEESAEDLANQLGDAIPPADPEQSAEDLAEKTGDSISPTDSEESASDLAEQRKLAPPTTPMPANATSTKSIYSMANAVNGSIAAIATQSDGSVVIGGEFNQVAQTPRANLARIKADGTLDDTFMKDPTDGINGTVAAIVIDSKGRIIVGGSFNTADDKPCSNLARFNPDGSLDGKFCSGGGPNGKVLSLAIQSDGSIIVGGNFSQFAGKERANLAKLAPTGELADGLPTANLTGSVAALAALPDGPVVAGGDFQASPEIRNLMQLTP
ncbi:MAG: delta-60 repeat domain-containing protein [Chthoniobacterales bacterium]